MTPDDAAGPAPAPPLARVEVLAGISVIVPTFREAENIPLMIERLDRLRQDYGLDLELIFVDDNSRDGSVEVVEAAGKDWVRMIVRSGRPSLSLSVIEGLQAARHPVLVSMDCDLSHPPEAIPAMILALEAGHDFVIGSRYVRGGTTDDDWGILRWLNSGVATLLARPLTSARDPMSGFFALRRADFETARDLNPVGYKIGLELIVKCGFGNVGEVPIHFADRRLGQSKLTLRQQLLYLKHLRRLYIHRFSHTMALSQFLVVGASGVVVNLGVLTLLEAIGLPDALCLAAGIGVSLVSNFLLNRRFTFSYARHRPVLTQFGGFLAASAVGAAVSFGVSLLLRGRVLGESDYALQLAALGGIAAGTIFNYLGNRYVVFRQARVRDASLVARR